MAFSNTTIQPALQPVAEKSNDNAIAASLLSMLVLSVFAAQKSKKAMRKLKRHFMWTAFKLKMKSLFKKANISDRNLLILLLALLVVILLFAVFDFVVALIVLLILLILYLLGILKI